METLWNILLGNQAFDEHFFQGDGFLFIIHLLEMAATFGVALVLARKVYRRRVAQKPAQVITRAGDNADALSEATTYFIQRVRRSTNLLVGVVFLLVALFFLYIGLAVAWEHASQQGLKQALEDTWWLLGIGVLIGGFGLFFLRDA